MMSAAGHLIQPTKIPGVRGPEGVVTLVLGLTILAGYPGAWLSSLFEVEVCQFEVSRPSV